MKIESIKTKRLLIRNFEREDARYAISIWNDPMMGEYLLDESMDEIDDAYLKEIEELPNDDICCYLISELIDTHERIGTCSFIPSDNGKVYDIAYCVHRNHWRNGYATEMVKGMISYAREQGASRITVVINLDNVGSNKIVQNLGFQVIGEKTYKKRGTDKEFLDHIYELI